MPGHPPLTGGRIRRSQPRAAQEAPAGTARVLIALVGLFRHFREGFNALEQQLFKPNEVNMTASFSIALFTDPSGACSPKEQSEARCDCVQLPADITAAAASVYGARLVKVRLAQFSNPKARLADAWYSEGGLRLLTPNFDVTLVLRPDARLTLPLLIRTMCWQPQRLAFEFGAKPHGRSLRSTIGNTAHYSGFALARRPPEQLFMNNGGWTGYLACGALSAAVALSFDEEESQMERPTVVSDIVDERVCSMELLSCTGTASGDLKA